MLVLWASVFVQYAMEKSIEKDDPEGDLECCLDFELSHQEMYLSPSL